MPFSLRLTADLSLGLAARAIRAKNNHPLILEVLADGGIVAASDLFSETDKCAVHSISNPAAELLKFRSPIIWIGGADPLDHPEIARFTNELTAAGRHVFLQSIGAQLKRRLHEFRPSNHFYFAFRVETSGHLRDECNNSAGASRDGMEALRMARLAGFFTCAHLVLYPDAEADECERLHDETRKVGVDGFLITPSTVTPKLQQKVAALRRRLLNRRWALLSRLFDSVALPPASRSLWQRKSLPLSESQPDTWEEGAEA